MSTFIKRTSVYFSANILNAAVPFLLLPILTRYLSVEEYGQIAMFQLLIAGLAGLVGLNTVGAAGRKFYDENITEPELAAYNTSCLWILLFTGGVTAFLTFLFNEKIASLLSIPIHWIYLAIIISFTSFIIQLRLSQWQIRGEAKKYGFLQVGNSLFNLLGSLIFVVLFSMGAQGRIDAMFITGFVISLVSIYLLVRHKLLTFSLPNRKNISEALNFGVPLVPHVFGIFLLSSADRYVINDNIGLAAAGVYLLAIQLSGAFLIVFDAINKSYVPYLFSALRDNKAEVKFKIVKYTYYYFIVLIIMALAGFYVAPHVLLFIAGDKFKEAGEVIGWLLFSQIFGGMYLMVTNYIFYSKETKLLSLVTIASGILNVILLYALIPTFGIKGAAFASCLSMFVRFLLTWYIAAKKIEMPWLLSYRCHDI
jgi:O-antigen/teichoic acid export membrane protein